jgi:hypothetical protein
MSEIMAELPQIWRIQMKPAAEKGCDAGDFCIQGGVLGFGWPVEPDQDLTWEAYRSLGKAKYPDPGWKAAANGISRMQIRDLCWTRTAVGKYWLGRVAGEWQYRNRPENYRADVLNVRDCQWACIGEMYEVPGKIINSFRASRALQKVEGDGIRLFSMFTSNSVHSGEPYRLPNHHCDLFSLLCPEDCEDVVGVYLQMNGYVLFPGTCKMDTKQFEFILRHRETGRYAAVQVKQGGAAICDQEYCQFDGDVFLFQTDGCYEGTTFPNVHRLIADEMQGFCERNLKLLPARVQRWMAVLGHLRATAADQG